VSGALGSAAEPADSTGSAAAVALMAVVAAVIGQRPTAWTGPFPE
jgi:hypothetical protein